MKTKIATALRLWLGALIVLVGGFAAQPAYADLTILPTRVIFENRDRFAEVTLINTGATEKTYKIGWQFYRMLEDKGSYTPAPASLTDFDLSQHLVYSPRRVSLKPHEKQRIRLALRPAADTPPGEYRAHLQFMAERDVADDMRLADTPNDGKARVAINMNVGYSIPVFYSVGTSDADAEIESFSLNRAETGVLIAEIPIRRLGGPYSTHGYLYVYHTPPGGQEKLLGEVSNAHIFPEVSRRVFSVRLSDPQLSGGTVRVLYRHFDEKRNLVYDEKTFPLAN